MDQVRSSQKNQNHGGLWRRSKLRFWRNQNHQEQPDQSQNHAEDPPEDLGLDLGTDLEQLSRKLLLREDQVFGQTSSEEEQVSGPETSSEEDQLHRDLEALRDLIQTTIQTTFSCSSADKQEVLRSATTAIQQQEDQDQRWAQLGQGPRSPEVPESPRSRIPTWRPLEFLRTHNVVLEDLVESRLMEACEDQAPGPDLSSDIKRQVCRLGRRVKDDLLAAARTAAVCYPPHMNVLNVYVGLYHRAFSRQLETLSRQKLQIDDCRYLLLWVQQLYTTEVLQQDELQMSLSCPGTSCPGASCPRVSSLGTSCLETSCRGASSLGTSCLGPLLGDEQLKILEEQYVSSTEDKVKLWLNNLLSRETQSWRSGVEPEVLDGFRFSPLAVDVIQVLDASLSEFNCLIRNKNEARRLTVHLEDFLSRYSVCVQDLVKSSLSNIHPVIKAQLVCEQQLRDYVTGSASLSEEQKIHCMNKLSALRDSGYWSLTCPVQRQLKERLQPLWTPRWVDGSLPVVNCLLESVNENLPDLSDLKPACREAVLDLLHRDVVVHYVKKTLKMKVNNGEQQVGGASRMVHDARMIDSFFTGEEGGGSWLSLILRSVAEILRLQDPESIKVEIMTLMHNYHDLSDAHLSAMLSLKSGLSAADVRSIRRSLAGLRLRDTSTNHSPPFFSRVHIKGIRYRIRPMRR